MAVYRLDSRTGKEPNTWKIEHFANISGSEEFVYQLAMEMPQLAAAGRIFDPERQQVTEAILTICFEGLMPAFEDLKKIRASAKERLPILNERQLYEGLTRSLWVAYKGLLSQA